MKVGDYVRTDTGIIEKLEGIYEQNETTDTIIKLNKMGGGRYAYILDISGEFTEDFDKNFSRGNIIKSSPNIIDLIEVGDYVNGSKVIDIAQAPVKALYTEDIKQTGALLPIVNNRIESVLTKEQFESMKYKIGE